MVEEEILSDQDFFATETRQRREDEDKRLDRTDRSDEKGKKLKKQAQYGAGATSEGRKMKRGHRPGAI